GSAAVALAGPSVGAWVATISVGGGDGMAELGVGLRYVIPAEDATNETDVTVVSMPILRQGDDELTLHLSFDPLNPTAAGRSHLAFFDAGGAGAPAALDAFFVTARGYKTTLTPLAATTPLWPARIAFCVSPIFAAPEPSEPYFDYYLAPDGAFTVAVRPPEARAEGGPDPALDRLILGMSGLEYAGLPRGGGGIAFFRAGQPAFAPQAVKRSSTVGETPRLTALATTSYVAFLPSQAGAAGIPYYAQPRQSPLFTFGTDLGTGFMDFVEMVSATLPTYAAGGPTPATLPVGVYAGLDPRLATAARLLEEAALAPARRAAVGLPPASVSDEGDALPLAVTPQGLVGALTNDKARLTGVVIGNAPGPADSLLGFTNLGPKFRAALLANEVFFVVSNVAELVASASVRYRLDPATLALLPARGVPPAVAAALDNLLGQRRPPYPIFDDEESFVSAIDPVAHDYVGLILPVAGLLKPDLEGWKFQLSPRSWRGGESPTMMIFKFCNRTLGEMVADAGAWAWREAAEDSSRDVRPTQGRIMDIFAAAEEAPPGTPYRNFYDHVVNDQAWNGVLFLNAPISVAELPPELQFITAGIDLGQFYAHHIGFAVTPFDVTATAVTLRQTAVFALIDYSDPYDLVLDHGIFFAFKTLGLRARFANARLADFSAQVELMMNQLFGAELTKQQAERGNNLVLDGGFQRRSGAPSYSFALRGLNVFDLARSALQSVEVLAVQLQTATGTDTAHTVTTDFILSGNLRFAELAAFDLFSYGRERWWPEGSEPADGYLRYGNLNIRLSFPLASPQTQTFRAFEGQRISFDLVNSLARPRSLAQNFPARVSGCVAALPPPASNGDSRGQRPEDLGYVSVSAPVAQTPLTPPWYGISFDLDLGTLGALAGSVGLPLTLLAAWSPGLTDEEPPVYVGLRTSSGDPLSSVLPIQGVVRLGFRSFQFQAHDDDPETRRRSYMLRMRRFALSILGWSFPPGNADVFLFGNPDGSGRASLGWYGAYAPDENSKKTGNVAARPPAGRASTRAARRLLSGRRGLPPGEGV
ncbi:MAG TPA: hypothetical protein VIP46_11460, partial [Pyrinomonadaceae bacterium]